MIRWQWLSAILALAVFILYFFPEPTPGEAIPAPRVNHVLQHGRQGFDILSKSSFGDFDPDANRWLNLTGFRANDGIAWSALKVAKELATEQLYVALGRRDGESALQDVRRLDPLPEVFSNVTGYVRGPWTAFSSNDRMARQQASLNELSPQHSPSLRPFRGKVTGESGDLHISIVEKGQADFLEDVSVRGISAMLTLYQTSPEQSWQISLYGLHILETGSIVLVTASEKSVLEAQEENS
jgi:transmembrane E3 ubiquitin-protein ligase